MEDRPRVVAWTEERDTACNGLSMPLMADDPHEMLQRRNHDLQRMLVASNEAKAALGKHIDDLNRELAVKTARIAELEKALAKKDGTDDSEAQKEVDAKALALLDGPPQQAPTPSPGVRFAEDLTGTTVVISEDKCVAKATHSYNKLALTGREWSAADGAYAEFTFKELPARFSSIGVIASSGMARVNVNTDSIGEHAFSYAWCGDKYWSASLVTGGMSRGPVGGDWQLGSVVGVFVRHGAISFYLNGNLRHKHAFTGLTGKFRFAVGFGGPKTASGTYGQVAIRPAPGDKEEPKQQEPTTDAPAQEQSEAPANEEPQQAPDTATHA